MMQSGDFGNEGRSARRESIFRVVTGNGQRADRGSGVWDSLLELDPDVAFLQKVRDIPDKVRTAYEYLMHKATRKDGSPQWLSTALLVKGRIHKKLMLSVPARWMEDKLQRFSGNLIALEISSDNGSPIKAISVYSLVWPVDRGRLNGIDVTGV